MSEVIDTLAIEIAANDSFTAVAKPLLSLFERLEDAVNKNTEALGDYEKATEGTAKSTEKVNAAQDKSEKSTKKSTKALQDQEKQVKKNEKAAKNLLQAIGGFTKAIGALGTMIFAGVGLDRLAQEAAKTNKELDVTSKNLGMTSQSLASWRGAAELSGGSVEGLTGYLNNLSAGLTRLTVQGDTSVTQFFNALGINLLDGSQKAKKLEDIMLELADKFSTMDRVKAFGIAQQMGIDEGTFEMLAQGRQGLEEHLQKTAKIYKSNQQDLETARKLTAATSYLNQQFEGLKLMIANAAMPVLLKIAEITSKFFDYLQQHEGLVKGVFFGIAGAITAVMIPTLLKGAAAALAFIAPFLPIILIVGALAAAFGLLYDDYEKWANGGTSLFNWGLFKKWISEADFSVDNLKDAFADLLGGYKSWEEAVNAAKSWLELKGFTKDGEMSIDSLAEGFKNVAKDIYNFLLPALDKVLNVINLLLEGEFSQAWGAAKDLGKEAWNLAKETAKDTVLEGGITFLDNTADAIGKAVEGNLDGAWDSLKKGVSEGVSVSWKYAEKQLDKGMRFFDIWGGFEPDKGENSLSNPENKLMDSKNGFSQSNSTDYTKEKELSKGQFRGFGAEIDSYISEGAKMFGVDEKVLRGFVKMEDGWYGKKSNTGAIGTGQFTQGTWNDLAKTKEGQAIGMTMITKENFRTENDPRWNKRVNTLATALLAKKNGDYLKKYGIEATGENLYMAHNIGLGGFTRAMTGKATEADMLAMRQNGMKAGMTPQDFVQYQKGRYNNHYAQANKVRSNSVDMNAPIGGYAVANALNANQHTFATMQNLAQPQNINNNQKTEVAFNGGIHINSNAGTLGGTAQDFVNGVQNRVNVMQFNTGFS